MKKLALLLAICLLASMPAAPARADDIESGIAAVDPSAGSYEPSVEPAAPAAEDSAPGSATGAEGIFIESEGSDAAGEAEAVSPENPETAIPGDDAQAGVIVESGTSVDYSRDARYSPVFLLGYACVLSDAGLTYADGQPLGTTVPAGTIVYVHDRNLDDRLKIAVDTPEGPAVGWLRAEELRPMSPDETSSFVAAALSAGGARCFDAEGTLPLACIGAAEQVESTNEPVAVVAADAASQPEAEAPAAPAPEAVAEPEVVAEPEAAVIVLEDDAVSDPEAAADADAGVLAPAALEPAPEAVEPADDPNTEVLAPEAPQPLHIDPEGPQLRANEITLGEGETFALEGVMPEGRESAIAYGVDNPAVAEVDAQGVVRALVPGEARVRAEAEDGAWSECLVHVKRQPDAVSFEKTFYAIGLGERFAGVKVILGSGEGEFAGSHTLTPGSYKKIWIYPDDVIYGRRTGSTQLTVRTYNGLTATCWVKVYNAPKKIKLYSDKYVLGVGETGQLVYSLTKKSAGTVTFSSDQPSVVSVDPATGAIQGLEPGTARIWAVTYNGRKAYVTITVRPAPQTLALSPAEMTIGAGMRLRLTPALDDGAAGTVTYSPDDPAVVSVAADGTVLGLNPGETTVRATTYNGIAAECRVVVKPAPAYVALPWRTLYIGLGEVVQLEPDVGDSVSTFSYKSSNKKYVRAYSGGLIYGKKIGTAKITVRTYNGRSCKLKVVVRKAPRWISVSPANAELCVGETLQLSCYLQKKSSGAVTYSSGDESVAVVDPHTGLVTAVGAGRTQIVARCFNGRVATCDVLVYCVPEWIEASASFLELGAGQSFDVGYTLSPGSRSPVAFVSADPGVASVSGEGRITANAPGTVAVSLETNAPGVTDTVYVTVKPAPDYVSLASSAQTLNVDESCQLIPYIPEGSLTAFSYSSSDNAVATVSADGAVVAVSRGTATLTVTTHNGKTASVALTVLDPWYPESAALLNAPEQLKIGDTWQLECAVYPEYARPRLQWSSGNPAVATVDENGRIQALASGYATIRVVSAKNSDINLQFTLAVQMPGIAMVIPARTTDIAGIPGNLAKIEAIRATAIAQINALLSSGKIKSADAARRRSIVNSIFADYAFPWMTPAYQKYWKAANSEGGAKDFKPDIVYYGMPYISGSGLNRAYTAARAVSEGRYTSSGSGYYLLNRGRLLNKKYVGSDCSGLVSQAIWGTTSGLGVYRTCDIDSDNKRYRTISDSKAMRPGDLLCKPYAHVIMFLYYTNPEKTQMMIIENGGSEAGTNTVHCSVMYVSSYLRKGYKIRRLKTLG